MSASIKQRIKGLLKWSERYTHTDMVYLMKGGSWMSVGQVLTSLIGFGVALALANLLPKETFGAYQYLITIAGILSALTLPGLNAAISRAVARGREGGLRGGYRTRLQWGLLAFAVGLFVAGYYAFNENYVLAGGMLVIALVLPLKDSALVYKAYWQGKKRFDVFAKALVSVQFFVALALLSALVFTDSLVVLLAAVFGMELLAVTGIYLLTQKQLATKSLIQKDDLSLGKHLSVLNGLGVIVSQADSIILWHLLGPVPLAVYTFAVKVPTMMNKVLTNFLSVAFPKLSNRSTEQIKGTLLPKVFKMFALLLPVVAIYVFIAPWFYELAFPAYTDSVLASQLFSLTLLFTPFALLNLSFKAQAKKRELYIGRIFSAVVTIGTLLIFVPSYGILGAVAARLLSKLAGMTLQLFLFKRM